MRNTYTIRGMHAIRLAKRDGLTLNKYADPTEGERKVTLSEAEEIAREDAGLIFVAVAQVGWIGDSSGYNISDYFQSGRYLGPDSEGVEPTWRDA